MSENWTELKIKVPAPQADLAGAIANMVVPYGLYIEDYSDLEEGAREIAHIDLIDEEFDWFDVILMGYHKFVWPATVGDCFRFFTANYISDTFRQKAPPHVVARNTDAFVKAIEKWPIDVITHVNHGIRVDCRAIAQAAKEHGTYIELSGKHITFSDEEFLSMAETGVRFIMDSDAHSVDRITDFGPALALLERTGYPREEVAGFCTKPDFRSVREKRGRTSRITLDD